MYLPQNTPARQEKERRTVLAAQHTKCTDYCPFIPVFCFHICSQELPVSSNETEVQLVESSLSTPPFDVKLGSQTSKRDLGKI